MGRIAAILLLLLLAACGQKQAEQPQSAAIPFKPTGDVLHLMHWLLEPAADHLWDSAGFVITDEGMVDLQPTTEEGWLAVQHSAVVVAEAGNLLMMPGLARDEGDWREISLGLIEAGLQNRAAAEAHDAEALFEAGGLLYRVCLSCHAVYIQGEQKPDIEGPVDARNQ
jgi:hypothetical protein